jgi:hypothetical protein
MRQLAMVTILSAAIGALVAPACGANDAGNGDAQLGGSSGSTQGGSSGRSGSGGGGRGGSGGTGTIKFDADNSGGSSGSTPVDGGCTGLSSAAESVVVYEPIALFIMQDRSGSMVTGFPAGSANSWPNSVAALNTFVTDPASQGLEVGLGFSPPTSNSPDAACGGCIPVVPIGPIAQTGPQINAAMNANAPNPLNFTPLQCGLQGMIDACVAFMAQRGMQCVGVFVTDGNTQDPTYPGCDTNITNLLKIVSDGQTKKVKTFALGLVSGALQFVDQVAQAGGTNKGFDLTQGGAQAFVAALNAIRATVTTQTKLPCQWFVPPSPGGQTLDPNKVNLQFSPSPGAPPQPVGHVASQSDCAAAGGGWYYDNPNAPTKVIACPETCTLLTNSKDGQVDLIFGCKTINAVK